MPAQVRLSLEPIGPGWINSKLAKLFRFSLVIENEDPHALETICLKTNLDAAVVKWKKYAKDMGMPFTMTDEAKTYVSKYLWEDVVG
jgi:hypothetical protein